MGILVYLVKAGCIERAGSADYSVDFISLLQEKECEIRSILPR